MRGIWVITTPKNLFSSLQPAWPLTNAHVAQEGKVEPGVDPAVVVAAGLGNTPTTFQVPKVFGTDTELATGFTYVDWRCCNPASFHPPMVLCVLWQARKTTHQKSVPGSLPSSR